MIKEIPPLTTGNANADLMRMREYLIRLSETLESTATVANAAAKMVRSSSGQSVKASEEQLRQQAQNLKSLIIKTADKVYEYIDGAYTEERSRVYLAQSDFGSYLREEETYIQALASGVIENYDLFEAIESDLGNYYNQLTGYIRRGIVTDPSTGEEVIGIAIAQENVFTAETSELDGKTYYEIAPGQTFGLYTSTGWQFWISGMKKGYFSSEDGMLHVENVYIEQALFLGDKWVVENSGGFGIRWVGA